VRILMTILSGVLFLAAVACNRSGDPPQTTRPMAVTVPRDTQISEDARRSLDARGLKYVQVQTENGEVTLTGEVEDPDEKRQAEESLKTVPGVVKVNNNISVVVEERMLEKNIKTNKPGGPRKEGAVKTTKPGGPRRDSSPPF